MPNEPSIEEIVAEMERAHASCPNALHWYTLGEDLRAIIADWRKRGQARDSLEKELDVLSASHKDLAHRLARMGEALKPFAEQQFTGSRATLICGHPHSLEIRSVESDYRACELCEARSMQRDAEAMESKYRTERDAARALLREIAPALEANVRVRIAAELGDKA